MQSLNPVAGQLFDVFETEEIQSWVDVFLKIPSTKILDNDCHGVDEKNSYNFWFQRTIFSRIQKLFGQDLHLMFGMFLNETRPWGIHTDAYHCNEFIDRKPALSMLIPYSVDHNPALIERASTIVFDQIGDSNRSLETQSEKDQIEEDNSAFKIYKSHLSHNSESLVKKLTIQGIYQWKHNSIIYWNSNNLHDTDNFIANGFTNKQAIVIHTFLPK
jgi:hypothetical protein